MHWARIVCESGGCILVRSIVRDPVFLAQPSAAASRADADVIADLTDTLRANADRCVGLAANMIGARKRILVFAAGPFPVAMVNPVVLKRSEPYETEEGCLSLDGQRRVTRYRVIEVEYLDGTFQKRRQTFRDFVAQIIQHEMDHFEGILI